YIIANILFFRRETNLHNLYSHELENSVEFQKQLLSLFEVGESVLFKWNNDKQWSVNYVSPSVYKFLGYTEDEFTKNKILYSSCINKDDLKVVSKELENAGLNKEKKFFKHKPYRVITKDGIIKWVLDYTIIIRDNDGDITHYLGYINDITEQKDRDFLLSEQSKMASMGEMIGNIAHQWRQPLSIISTSSSGMQMQKEFGMLSDEKFEEACNVINQNVQYLSKTIDDFRNFIKGEREKKLFDLEEEIESFLNIVNGTIKKNNIKLILDIKNNIKIDGYENELTQCLINIFNNAKDELEKNSDNERLIFISTQFKNNNAIIKIKDTAGGIPTNILTKIFEPYFTTKHKIQGTGLGLHMTYNMIVDGMGGSIVALNTTTTYENKKFNGAEFVISLPLE
ncbi:MAG: PAS domain-containing protein, partial [Campylobacterota bacterium]|nr:PAS domain-containing protein [Campylobacterota bacterium]